MLGDVSNVQAVNNVPFYGSNYFHGWMRDDSLTGGMSKLFVKADSDIRAELADILVQNGIAYISMNVERANLEDIFLKLTDNGGEAFTAEEDAAYAGTEENEEEEGDE